MPGYLVIRNWDRYQHYKNRRPIWVKFYTDLLDDYELSALPIATRLLYDQFLLLAGRTDNLIPNDVRWIAGKTHIDEANVARSIDDLLAIGFVRPVSRKPPASTERASNLQAKSLPSRAPAQSQEVETEVEKEPLLLPTVPLPHTEEPLPPADTSEQDDIAFATPPARNGTPTGRMTEADIPATIGAAAAAELERLQRGAA